jgi:hypothetical protein
MVEMDGDFVVVAAVHVVDVAVPAAARIVLELVARPAGQQVEGAFDVGGGEGPAVMPFHAAAQLEGELGLVLVPAPRFGEVGHDRLVAVLRHRWVEHDEVVEHRHEGHDGGRAELLVDRGARRVVALEHAQHAAALLRQRSIGKAQQCEHDADKQHGRPSSACAQYGHQASQCPAGQGVPRLPLADPFIPRTRSCRRNKYQVNRSKE